MTIRVASFARAKQWGFFQAVHYFAEVERTVGSRAVLFELEMQMQMDKAEAEKLGDTK